MSLLSLFDVRMTLYGEIYLAQSKRRVSEVRYDTLHTSSYDQNWGHMNASHRSLLQRFLALCSPGCTILDAACGTGKYWSLILESGRSVVGIDQS